MRVAFSIRKKKKENYSSSSKSEPFISIDSTSNPLDNQQSRYLSVHLIRAFVVLLNNVYTFIMNTALLDNILIIPCCVYRIT